MVDLIVLVVDIVTFFLRTCLAHRFVFLIGGLLWWLTNFFSFKKEEPKEQETENGKMNKAQENDLISAQMSSALANQSLDSKLDSSHGFTTPRIYNLPSNVFTDSEAVFDDSKSNFETLRSKFENNSLQGHTDPKRKQTLDYQLGNGTLSKDQSEAFEHEKGSLSPTSDKSLGSQTINASYSSDFLNLSPTRNIMRTSPHSLGNTPLQSPQEQRKSRSSKRLSVCGKCRTAGKSTSWSEADSLQRGRVKRTPDKEDSPATQVFYCGRYINVTNGTQVQIGDHCHMVTSASADDLNSSMHYDDGSFSDQDSVLLSDGDMERDISVDVDSLQYHDDNYDSDNENEDDCEPLVCSFCRAKMTDDEKSLLLPLEEVRRPVRSITFPGVSPGIPNDGVILTSQMRSASVSVDTCLPSITDEEKEKLFREKRIKIFKATQQLRQRASSSPSFERENTERISLRNLTFWRRRKQSTDSKNKSS